MCTEVSGKDAVIRDDEDDIDFCGASSVDGDSMQLNEDENIDAGGGLGSSGSGVRTA